MLVLLARFALAAQIAKRRKELHTTQRQLAEAAHLRQGTLSRIEQAQVDPALTTVCRLGAVLRTRLTLSEAPQ